MKSLTFFLPFGLLIAFAPLLSAQQGYKIEAKVKGFDQSEAYLAYYYGNKQYIKDTVSSENGRFVFEGEEPLDRGIYLVVLPPKNIYFELMVDLDQHFSLETDTADFIQHMKFQGSRDNELFYKDMVFLGGKRRAVNKLQEQLKQLSPASKEADALKEKIGGIDEEIREYREAFIQKNPDMLFTRIIQAMEEPVVPEALQGKENQRAAFYYYRNEFLKGIDFADDRLLRTPILHKKVETYLEKLTVRHPDSIKATIDQVIDLARPNPDVFQYLVVNILNKYAKSKIMGMDAVYVHMVEKYYMSGDASWADSTQVAKLTERALAISPTIIGRKAPNFRVQDAMGDWQHLHGTPGEFTILYFWDYDCGHCKKVTPKLAEIYQDYQDKNVSLFAVSINGDVAVWKEKLKEYGLENGINVQDHRRESGFDQMYDIRSTPRIFILDENKKDYCQADRGGASERGAGSGTRIRGRKRGGR